MKGKLLVFTLVLFSAASTSAIAGRVDTVLVASKAMDTTYKAVVVVPEQYETADRVFPVVYLLHGWSGNYSNWANKADLGVLADRYRIILVCPEGGYAGWYLDSPLDPGSQFETYIVHEVLPYIDGNYRTINEKQGRAITGLSMGGHGAIALLSKHPDKFIAGGSMSGVMALQMATNKYSIEALLGEFKRVPNRWNNESCMSLITQLKDKKRGVLIDCGTGDRFIEVNRAIHHKMMALGIPHDYIERPGKHTWNYWTRALPYQLQYFREWLVPPTVNSNGE